MMILLLGTLLTPRNSLTTIQLQRELGTVKAATRIEATSREIMSITFMGAALIPFTTSEAATIITAAHKVISVITVNPISEDATPNQTSVISTVIMISIATLQTSQEDATLATATLIIVILETASMVLLTVATATASALVKGLVLVVIVPRPDSVASVVETLAALVVSVADSAVVLMAALVVSVADSAVVLMAALVVSVADSAVVLMAALVDSAVVLAAHHNAAPVDSADEAADSVTAVAPKYSTSTMKSARMSVTATAATSELISYL
jgi:hypothetical protein